MFLFLFASPKLVIMILPSLLRLALILPACTLPVEDTVTVLLASAVIAPTEYTSPFTVALAKVTELPAMVWPAPTVISLPLRLKS